MKLEWAYCIVQVSVLGRRFSCRNKVAGDHSHGFPLAYPAARCGCPVPCPGSDGREGTLDLAAVVYTSCDLGLEAMDKELGHCKDCYERKHDQTYNSVFHKYMGKLW